MSCRETLVIGEALAGLTGPAVLATLFEVEGSSYRRPGARLLWTPAGLRVGGISGGCLEEDLVARCALVAEKREAEVVVYDTTKEDDLLWGTGLGCHGRVSILLEYVENGPTHPLSEYASKRKLGEKAAVEVLVTGPQARHTGLLDKSQAEALQAAVQPRSRFVSRVETDASGARRFRQVLMAPPVLAIFGAGDDAVVLASQAVALGWDVLVTDPRRELLAERRFPGVYARYHEKGESSLSELALPDGAVAVVMSHHYRFDKPWLAQLLSAPLSYIGLLGPRKRGERLLADLEKEGLVIPPDFRERFHSPMGLNLGGDGAQAIALATLAEIQGVLHGREGGKLSGRTSH